MKSLKMFTALALMCLLALPLFAQTNTYQIVRADYGSGNTRTDVTQRVLSLVQGNLLNFKVSATALGASSRRGNNRVLRLQLQDSNGNGRQLTFRDNQQVRVRVNNSYQSSLQNNLQINRATYGSQYRSSDVTARLNSQIQNNQLNLQVNNNTMGGDPDQGRSKTLNVEYTLNGQTGQQTLREGDMLQLASNVASNNDSYGSQNNLQIRRATYGSQYRSSDVTARLNSQIQNNQLNLQVNNGTMGGDPDPGRSKTLSVEYTLNGQTGQQTLRENDMLQLASNVVSNNDSYGSQNNLQIRRATYGSQRRSADVTSRLNSQVRNNQLNLQVNSNAMGGDPDPGQAKTLTVEYTLNGQNGQSTARDGEMLSVPYNNTSGLTQRIRCESLQSSNYGRTYCATDTRNGVRLTQNLGTSQCTQGSSWGYDTNGIWVDHGCRAEFDLQGDSRYSGSNSWATIPTGTELSVRTNELIDSKNASEGQTFSASIASDILDSTGGITIPRGSEAQLIIRRVASNSSDMLLDVNSLTVSGTRYLVSTGDLTQKGGQGVGANQKTAVMVGGGAALGTLIGAIVGGGKGAAIGAAVGAGAGVGTEVLTKGNQVKVPAETLLSFKLDQDLHLQPTR